MRRSFALGSLIPVLLSSVPVVASAAVPPPAGQVLRQVTPTPVLPSAPGSVLELPAPSQQASTSTTPIPVQQIQLLDNTLLSPAAVAAVVKPLEGKTVPLRDLEQAALTLTVKLHEMGYPLAYVYVPAQKINDGLIQMQVIEPRYDQIAIHNSGRFQDNMAQYSLGVLPGDLIASSSLNRGLLLLNQTPGIRVAGTFVPGSQPRTSTLDVQVHNQPMVSGEVGVNDYGGNYTGRIQWQGQVNLLDPFGMGGEISANGLTSSAGLLHAAGLSLLSPNLWDGLRANAFASWTHYRLGQEFSALDETGSAIQWGAGLNYPILLQPGELLNAGVTFIQNRFNQQSGINSEEDSVSQINLVQGSLNGSFLGGNGVSAFGLTATWGNKSIENAAAQAIDAAGPKTAGTFWIGQLQLQRLQNLPAGFRLDGDLSGQIASKNLDPSQQIYLGGPQGVMAYSVGTAGGDQGILARLSLSHRVPLPLPGHLRLAALLQGGEVWQYHNFYVGAPDPNRLGLAGAGLGVQYRWHQAVQLSLDWVHRLGNTANTNGANQYNQFWAQLQVFPAALL